MLQQRVFLDTPAEREAVEPRQQHVAHQDVGRVVARQVEGFESVARACNAVSARLQQSLDRGEVLIAFVGQQDGLHGRASMPRAGPGTNGRAAAAARSVTDSPLARRAAGA